MMNPLTGAAPAGPLRAGRTALPAPNPPRIRTRLRSATARHGGIRSTPRLSLLSSLAFAAAIVTAAFAAHAQTTIDDGERAAAVAIIGSPGIARLNAAVRSDQTATLVLGEHKARCAIADCALPNRHSGHSTTHTTVTIDDGEFAARQAIRPLPAPRREAAPPLHAKAEL